MSPGVPSLGGSASPDNDITIEWVDSNSLTPLVYWVDYTLLRMDGSMDMGQATVSLLPLHSSPLTFVIVLSFPPFPPPSLLPSSLPPSLQIEGVTSVTLTGQQAFTNVTAVVTAYTLWTGSEPSDPGNFFSHPAREYSQFLIHVHVHVHGT